MSSRNYRITIDLRTRHPESRHPTGSRRIAGLVEGPLSYFRFSPEASRPPHSPLPPVRMSVELTSDPTLSMTSEMYKQRGDNENETLTTATSTPSPMDLVLVAGSWRLHQREFVPTCRRNKADYRYVCLLRIQSTVAHITR
jgi:hypothetical protein